jgi:hypothetical protein
VYFTDRGIEELAGRRGEEEVSLAWLADQLQAFVDQHPDRTAGHLAGPGRHRRRRRGLSAPPARAGRCGAR